MDKALKISHMNIAYQDKKVIKDMSIDFKKNKITAIIGPSGCGKSSLLLSLNGLLTEKKGVKLSGVLEMENEKIFYGNIFKNKALSAMLRENIGIVFQQPVPFPLSIEKNMAFALKYNGVSKMERQAIIEECLKSVNLYDEIKNDMKKSAKKLSGGQQQRLCIARALTTKPKILLLDEPCSALDVKNIEIIEKLLLSFKEAYTIILVTHNIGQAKRIADEVVFILDGVIVEKGSKDEMFNHPKDARTKEYLSGDFG